MATEYKSIISAKTTRGTVYCAGLSKLPIIETVKIYFLNKEIIPIEITKTGMIYFTKQQYDMYSFKEDELKRKGISEEELFLEITYEEASFNIPRENYDTIESVKNSLTSLEALNELLDNRRLSSKYNSFKYDSFIYLHNEFMLFGLYYLNICGEVLTVDRDLVDSLIPNDNVEYYDDFKENNRKSLLVFSDHGYTIPKNDDVCSCCGKKFTIEDIEKNPCICFEDNLYHRSCYKEYIKLKEINKLVDQIMARVYEPNEFTFELIPNGYNTHYDNPWILFHTVDGDIILGWRRHVLSIEWFPNYKEFNYLKVFENENNTTRWSDKDGKRGIHASDWLQAYKYLMRVRKSLKKC